MRLLADTHVLLWWLADDAALPARHRELLADPDHDVFFSAVSIAEIAIKTSLGKLDAPDDAAATLTSGGFDALPFTPEHAEELRRLPWHHRDPFDRMLISQARSESLALASVDRAFEPYAVTVL